MREGLHVGRFEIVREIGRGGMARVHLARQLDLDRYVALKELGSLQREDAELVKRFARESRLGGALNHPNIVTVLEFFEHDEIQYIAMEYVQRGSLRPWIGRLSLSQVGGIFESIFAGLAHAHARDVVHRDLKPENLMVTDEGRIKIADFGIAKALAEEGTTAFRTATGVAIGTPVYMSPEQALAKEVGPWTDLYTTGVIAYELLGGSLPFAAGEPLAILLAHCNEPPPPLSARAPDVPAPLAAWVHRLLAKDGADRPPSARAAWEELEEHLLDALGPRWRRDARIEGEPGAPRPATPARTITPAHFSTDPPADDEVDDDWETVASSDAAAPVAARTPPGEPEPDEPPIAAASPPAAAKPEPDGPPIAAASPPAAAKPEPDGPPTAAATPRRRIEPAPDEPATAVGSTPAAIERERARRPRTRGLFAGAAALAGVAVVLVLALGGGGDDEKPAERVIVAGVPSAAAPLGDNWLRAIHLWTYSKDGYKNPEFAKAVRLAKTDGATHIVLHPYLEPVSESAAQLRDKQDAPPSGAIGDGIEAVNREGLRTIVQPIVEPPGTYAGVYDPDDADAFFTGYAQRLRALADAAGEHGVDVFVAGTMLSNLDDDVHSGQWVRLIADVRGRCDCRVSYAAEDLEGAADIGFWPAVDLLGVITFEPLTDEPTLDPAVLTAAWGERKAALKLLSERNGKPVWLTELAFASRDDQASTSPFDDTDGKASEEAQAVLYEAAFRAMRGTPNFAGIGWQELNGDGEPAKPRDYQFAGKQAERVLRAWQTAR